MDAIALALFPALHAAAAVLSRGVQPWMGMYAELCLQGMLQIAQTNGG
jgi:hypothetical protein